MNILRSTLFALWALLWTLLTAPLVIGGALLLRGLWGYHFGKLWRLGIQWGVENLLVDNGPDGYSGESLTVDAVNGRVLGRTTWSAVQ